MESIRFVYDTLFGPGLVTAPAYLALAALAAWAVWRWRGEGQGFWRWLLPARIWKHPSHWIDLQLFVLSRILAVLGIFGGVALTTGVAALVAAAVPAILPAKSLGPVALAFLLWLPSDFALFRSFAKPDAIDSWMPFRMFAVEIPRDTMLMTSVSASTAQMPETFSGADPWREIVPISESVTPRYREIFSRNCPVPDAHWLVIR